MPPDWPPRLGSHAVRVARRLHQDWHAAQVRDRRRAWRRRGITTVTATGTEPAGAAVEQARRQPRAWVFEVVLLLTTAATAILTVLARAAPYFAVDLTVERDFQSVRSGPLDTLAAAVSWCGFPPQSTLLFGVIVLILVLTGRRWQAAGTAFAAAGSAGIWFVVAPLVHRDRPDPELVRVALQIPRGSFPSGHVLIFTATFGFLAFVAWQARRPGLGMLSLLPPIAIAVSRVYLGEHWPSDVLGGFLFGGLWLMLTVRLYCWARRRHAAQQSGPQHGQARVPVRTTKPGAGAG
jgi:undecaprenyl-diphosphatase